MENVTVDMYNLHMARKVAKKLVRPTEGRMVAGVCLAIANHIKVDVSIVRIIWAFLLLPGGIPGLVPYVLCWIIIPSED